MRPYEPLGALALLETWDKDGGCVVCLQRDGHGLVWAEEIEKGIECPIGVVARAIRQPPAPLPDSVRKQQERIARGEIEHCGIEECCGPRLGEHETIEHNYGGVIVKEHRYRGDQGTEPAVPAEQRRAEFRALAAEIGPLETSVLASSEECRESPFPGLVDHDSWRESERLEALERVAEAARSVTESAMDEHGVYLVPRYQVDDLYEALEAVESSGGVMPRQGEGSDTSCEGEKERNG